MNITNIEEKLQKNFRAIVFDICLETISTYSGLKGFNAVEVGCMFKGNEGFSTFKIANFIKNIKGENKFYSIEYDSSHVEAAKEMLHEIDESLLQEVTFLCGHSLEMLPMSLQKMDKVDFISLDGGAHPEVCLQEFELALSKLSDSGLIVIDDLHEIAPSDAYSVPRLFGKGTLILPYMIIAEYLKYRNGYIDRNNQFTMGSEGIPASQLISMTSANRLIERLCGWDYRIVYSNNHKVMLVGKRKIIEAFNYRLRKNGVTFLKLSHAAPDINLSAIGNSDSETETIVRKNQSIEKDKNDVNKIERIIEITRNVDGRIAQEEAELIYFLARDGEGEGTIVEIGSYQGYSTIWLASGSKCNGREKVYAIDPHNSREHGFNEAIFRENINRAKIDDHIIPIVATSSEAAKKWKEPIRFLWIDGAHDYDNAKNDFLFWEKHLIPGGIIAYHDYLSILYPGVTKAVKEYLFDSGRFLVLGCVNTVIYARKVDKLTSLEILHNEHFLRLLLPRKKAEENFHKSHELIQENKIEEARSLLMECADNIRLHYSQKFALVRLLSVGNAFSKMGEYHEAEKIYLEVLSFKGDEVLVTEAFWALHGLGNISLCQGRYEDAEKRFKDSLSIETISNERKIVSVLSLGQCYADQGREEDAENEYLKALTDGNISSRSKYQLNQKLGYIYLMKESFEKAGQRFSEALSIDVVSETDRFYSLLGLGKCYLSRKDNRSAVDIYKEALSKKNIPGEKMAEVILGLGQCYVNQGKVEEAEEIYNNAISIEKITDRSRYRLLQRLGDIYLRAGKYHQAEQKFNDALSVNDVPEKEREHAVSGIEKCRSALSSCSGGKDMDVDKKKIYEGLSKCYFGEERHEKEITDHLPEILADGELFVDIGASLGQYSFFANKHMRGGRIISVEADPIRFEKLKENCRAWEKTSDNKLYAVHAAVSDRDGKETFHITNSSVSGALFKREIKNKKVEWKKVEVNCITLDTICKDYIPDFVKIDVEGADLRVLRGAVRILKEGKTKFLIEVHGGVDPEGQRNPEEVFRFMELFGYRRVNFYGRDLFVNTSAFSTDIRKPQAIIDKHNPHEAISKLNNPEKMNVLKNLYKGQRCFIIGNGPSLNQMDLSKLKNEITFGVNSIFYNFEKMGFKPTFYVVEDKLVAEDRADEINLLTGMTRIYGEYLQYCLKDSDEVVWANVNFDFSNYPGFPHFSKDASECMWVGGTVSYLCMQLAYYMGFSEVYLIGFDHNYVIPEDADVEGTVITSVSNDPNHFHPEYFGKGKRWHDPRLDRMEKAYVKACNVFEHDGRKIYNATAGGKLEQFDRVPYNSLFTVLKEKIDFLHTPASRKTVQVAPVCAPMLRDRSNSLGKSNQFSHLVLDYTRLCNSRCTYCSIWKTKKGPELSLESIERIFSSLQPFGLGACYVTGGEPYISDKIIDIARLLNQYLPGCRITGATNAVQPQAVLKRMDSILNLEIPFEVHVSVNGSETVHDATRGLEGNWKNVVSLIKTLKSQGVDIIASMSLMPQTIMDIPYMQEFCGENDIRLMFSWVRQSVRYDTVDDRYSSWPEKLKPRLKEIEFMPDYFDCPGLSERLVIDPEGNVYPCEVYHPEILIGNVYKDSIGNILNSSRTDLMKEMIASKGCFWCQGAGENQGSPKWMSMDCYRRHARQKTFLAQELQQAVDMPPEESKRVIDDILSSRSVHQVSSGIDGRSISGDKSKVRISVMICTYRNPQLLGLAIESLLNQTLEPELFEVIVVDNNSMDSTMEVVSRYPGVTYLMEAKQGLSYARNAGIKTAKGDIIAFIDDDAEASPVWLKSLLKIYDEHPGVMAAGGKVLPAWDALRPEWLDDSYLRALSLVEYGEKSYALTWPERIIGTNCSFKRDVFKKFGSFDTCLGRIGTFLLGSEDTEIQQRILSSGHQVYYTPDAVVYHHVPASRMTRKYINRRSEGHHITEKILALRNENKDEEIQMLIGDIREKIEEDRKRSDMNTQGEKLFLDGDIKSAKEIFLKILQKDPEFVEVHNNIGVLYWQTGDLKSASRHFTKALNLDPNHRETIINCVELLKSSNDYATAQKLYESYLTRNPKEKDIMCLLDDINDEISENSNGSKCNSNGDEIDDVGTSLNGKLIKYKDKHKGQRCVIIGNGPSLNNMDLSFLKDEITFGLNRIYLGFDKWDFKTTYYVSVNQLVIEQNIKEILGFQGPKFLALNDLGDVSDSSDIVLLKTVGLPSASVPVFSKDPRSCIWEGFTVTYVAMQLAYYMGFSEVVLIGVDHHFATRGPANKEIMSGGEDPNHFHPEYFGRGVRWHLPDLHNSEVAYRAARIAFESSGRRIIDATVNGKLTIFPKADYRELLIKQRSFKLLDDQRRTLIAELTCEAERKAEEDDISGALKDSLKITEQYPEAATAHNNLGVLYLYSGEIEKSLEHTEKAMRIDPANAEAVMNCANIFALAGEMEKVKIIYETFMQRENVEENIARLLKELIYNIGSVEASDLQVLSPAHLDKRFHELIVLISIGNALLSKDYEEAITFCTGLLKYPQSSSLVNFQKELLSFISHRTEKKVHV